MLLPGRQSRGWAMRPGPSELLPLPGADPALEERAIALYQTAHRLFYGRRYHEDGAAR